MNEKEIIQMFIRELTQDALSNMELEGINKNIYEDILELGYKIKDILNKLPKEQCDLIMKYHKKSIFIAECEREYLYIKGAKDCIKLLKTLGVI